METMTGCSMYCKKKFVADVCSLTYCIFCKLFTCISECVIREVLLKIMGDGRGTVYTSATLLIFVHETCGCITASSIAISYPPNNDVIRQCVVVSS